MLTNGTVNISELVRGVLRELPQPYDYKRAMTICQARLNQLPAEKRKGVVVKQHHLHQVASKMKHENGAVPTTSPVNRIITAPVAAPPPDTFSQPELMAAKALLTLCGNSLYRAQGAVKLIAQLIPATEGSKP